MQTKPEVLDRLLMSKSFLAKIRFQPVAMYDRHTLAGNIVTAHDAAELAIAGICDQLGCLPQKGNSYLMDYFESYKRERQAELFAREYFRNLNSARNLLKHQGLFPDAKQWSRVGETVFQHITKWCWDSLGESFSDLDESALILNVDVKRLYDEAKQITQQGDYKTALEKLSLALAMVFEENVALRGFEAGSANTEDAIRVVGFGIHGNDFLSLQQFLPRVSRWNAERVPQWKQSGFGHPGNWRENSAEFCLRTFVDVAVKRQGAPWIPGPLGRDVLYDQQIEALNDDVEFWHDVPDNSSDDNWIFGKTKRETKKFLRKNEKMRGRVMSPAGKKDVLSIGLIGNLEIWNVLASNVKVTCVPSENESVKNYFPWLPQIDWEPD
jgi:hypothetical protein